MKFEIRQINARYSDGDLESVQVIYTSKNEERSVSINGNFNMTAEEYRDNEAIEQLEVLAKNHLLNEVNAE